MKAKKHILFLTPGFPDSERDTRCIPALQLFVEELARRNEYEISIIAFHYPYIKKSYRWKGIRVFSLGGDNKQGVRRLLVLRRAIKLAKALNKKQPFDHIHSFWLGECAWVGNRLSKRFEVPHCCTLMGQDVLKNNVYLNRVKPLPKLIALSQFHNRQFLENNKTEADHIISWGIEEGVESSGEVKKTDVIAVGNLTELKNHDLFLEILYELKEKLPNIKAEIIGEGDKVFELQHKITQLKLEKNIKLTGVLSRKETLKRIGNAKCLLHTSDFESFGMVLVEGLALGTKVVSTPVGIAPELKSIITFSSKKEAVNNLWEYITSDAKEEEKKPLKIADTVNEYIEKVFG